ncbi:unnamed protein product [Adineta ricciae]|uniref:protein-serine/threonine phosphatase n=2 Tax=Adineta ricciae TaxID=249248 RepID=A0A815YLB8_ADIRI|nr:unnamed protein product [Adineta ricciae]
MASYSIQTTNRITPNLYIGCAKLARSKFFLDSNNIHGIINVTQNEPIAYPESYDYLRVNIDDEPSEQIQLFFQNVFEFIRRHHNLGHSVLVHCQMGVSRSATLVIAYLMIDGRKTLGEAFLQVKSARPQIDPNEGFIRQLRDLERSLFHQTMTLERISYQDTSIDESPRIVLDRVLVVLQDFTVAFADDASIQTLDMLKEKLLTMMDKVKHNHMTDLVANAICRYLRMFGKDDPFDRQARIGLQKGLSALCTFYSIELIDCIDKFMLTEEWRHLCVDVPLVNQWISDLRNDNVSIDM